MADGPPIGSFGTLLKGEFLGGIFAAEMVSGVVDTALESFGAGVEVAHDRGRDHELRC